MSLPGSPARTTPPAVLEAVRSGFSLLAGAQMHTAGVDVVDVQRLGAAVRRSGRALERRICTAAEQSTLGAAPAARLLDLAAVFGAKESVFKALGGIARGGRFIDIDTARPGPAQLGGATAAQAGRLGVGLVTGSVRATAGTVLAWALAVPTPQHPTPQHPTHQLADGGAR